MEFLRDKYIGMTRAETVFFFKCYSMCKRGILKEAKRNSNYASEEKKLDYTVWSANI